ncbi:MAG TPA: hypothetical protein VMU16_05045 [Candidatus Binataceae bacterium]|nr:hypothetical protein [Candidatus Binataceae bacterium]
MRFTSAKAISIAAISLILIGAGSFARADEAVPSGGDGGDWEEVNQVLEIPSVCTGEGDLFKCDETASAEPASSSTADADSEQGDATDGDDGFVSVPSPVVLAGSRTSVPPGTKSIDGRWPWTPPAPAWGPPPTGPAWGSSGGVHSH